MILVLTEHVKSTAHTYAPRLSKFLAFSKKKKKKINDVVKPLFQLK